MFIATELMCYNCARRWRVTSPPASHEASVSHLQVKGPYIGLVHASQITIEYNLLMYIDTK